MKNCSKCKNELSEDSFIKYTRKNGKTETMSTCRDCNKTYCRKRYHSQSKESRVATAREYRNRTYQERKAYLRAIVLEAKDRPCMDCNQRYPSYVLDMDHRDRSTKKNTVAKLVSQMVSEEVLRAEIAKCDVVCANCHRIRTFTYKKEIES